MLIFYLGMVDVKYIVKTGFILNNMLKSKLLLILPTNFFTHNVTNLKKRMLLILYLI